MALLLVPAEVIHEGIGMVTRTMPVEVSDLLTTYVTSMQRKAAGGLAIGAALLSLYGTARGAVALGKALDRVFEQRETRSAPCRPTVEGRRRRSSSTSLKVPGSPRTDCLGRLRV
jgi:uncharacterized BrkB/YihY/UPF0761 family membrane protein